LDHDGLGIRAALLMIIERSGKLSPEQSCQHDRRAPFEELSLIKRKALVACLQGDGILYKRSGAWTSSNVGPHADRFSGVTVADLSRDGLLEIRYACDPKSK